MIKFDRFCANYRAKHLPIPEDAPVINAVEPSNWYEDIMEYSSLWMRSSA